MKRITQALCIAATATAAITLWGCSGCGDKPQGSNRGFVTDNILSYTPVKKQGSSSLCWAYAMLSTIETEHIMRGDSVNLSTNYVARMLLREQADRCYLSSGKKRIKQRGTMPKLIRLIMDYGVLPYDSYHSDANISVVCRKLSSLAATSAARRTGLDRLHADTDNLLDNCLRPVPLHVYMFSMEYTPIEFAHSVCMPEEYTAYTSFTHIPMNTDAPLDIPDNDEGFKFHNIPIDSLMLLMEKAVATGHPVCWEGDVSEEGMSFAQGVADVRANQRNASQALRQREFETLRTTDDHCMSIVGIAHDRHGRKYFICKNSYGTDNPYGGLVYMSFDYARLKTIAVMMNSMVR